MVAVTGWYEESSRPMTVLSCYPVTAPKVNPDQPAP